MRAICLAAIFALFFPIACMAEELTFEGKVIAHIQFPVANIYPMRVDKLFVEIGQDVKKGERLVEYHLGPKEFHTLQAEIEGEGGLRDVRLNLANTSSELKTHRERQSSTAQLAAKGYAAAPQVGRENRQIANTQTRLNNIRQQEQTVLGNLATRAEDLETYLGFRVKWGQKISNKFFLEAPENGTVIDIAQQVRPGALVPAGARAFLLAVLNPIQVHIQVYEEEIMKLKPDQKVVVELANNKKIKLDGKIRRISWMSNDMAIATPSFYNAYIDVDNPDHVLKPGYKVLVHIEVE